MIEIKSIIIAVISNLIASYIIFQFMAMRNEGNVLLTRY